MELYAVIDTNVIVSALITKRADSPTRLVLDYPATENIKHFPSRSFIVTPAEMIDIIDSSKTAL